MKKILCILLVLAIVASFLCVPAFAADDRIITVDGVELPLLPSGTDYSVYKYAIVVKDSAGNLSLYLFDDVGEVSYDRTNDDGSVKVYFRGEKNFKSSSFNSSLFKWYGWGGGLLNAIDRMSYNIIASSFDIYDSNTGDLLVPKIDFYTDDGRVYPTDFMIKQGFYDTIDAVDTTLNTGVSMLGSVAQTIATTPLLFICFTVGFIGLGVALFRRIRK